MMITRKFALQLSLTVAAVTLAGTAQAADCKFTPSITVNEEYAGNIAEDKGRTIGDEFITRAIFGLAFKSFL